MSDNNRAIAYGTVATREPSPDGLGPSGFDPERVKALAEHIRRSAKSASEVARMMAQSKSLRQGHNPPRDDLYMWPEPEQTVEWEVADVLDAIVARTQPPPLSDEGMQ